MKINLEFFKKYKNMFYTIGLALFCLFLAFIFTSFGEILIARDAEHEESIVMNALHANADFISQEIQVKISNGIFATETLHAFLRYNGYRTDDFYNWGCLIVEGSSVASCVQLAPGGIVSSIFPVEGNERALGHDLLKDKRRNDGALKAINSRELTFVGPLKLIQNGKYSVIARKPVFRNINGKQSFWGFTIALLLIDDIISERIHSLEKQGISLKLEGENPDAEGKPVLYESGNFNSSYSMTVPINVPNGIWHLRLSHIHARNRFYPLIRTFIIIFSLLLAVYIFVQQSSMHSKQMEIAGLNQKVTELALSDELTDIGNRRAGMYVLENLVQQSKRYKSYLSVALVDLGFFKQINDTYGHPAGDEFMILFPQTALKQELHVLRNMRNYIEQNPFKINGKEIPVRQSIGFIEYRFDESVESVMHRVDEKLYAAKNSGRNIIGY